MDVIENVARAIDEGLVAADRHGVLENYSSSSSEVWLDGRFDLHVVTRAAIRATLQHYAENVSEGMTAYGVISFPGPDLEDGGVMADPDDAERVFRAMLSQAICELDAGKEMLAADLNEHCLDR